MENIDITKTPPTEAEIQEEGRKQKLHVKRLLRCNKIFLFGGLIAFSISVSWVLKVLPSLKTLSSMYGGLIIGALPILLILIIWDHVGAQIHKRAQKIGFLEQLSLLEREEVLALCKIDFACESYRLAVAKQGRILIKGELDAMKELTKPKKEQFDEHRHKEITKALLSTTTI